MTQMNAAERIGAFLIALAVIIALIWLVLAAPIAQNPDYHQFKDMRTLWQIPNFWNVVSNFPFFVVGLLGLACLSDQHGLEIVAENRYAYHLFFIGITLVSMGSGYYHLWPSNYTLMWDRLPMTIAFMALFSIIISEHLSARAGKLLLTPLIVCGILSVGYWWYTESVGQGDLRYYAIVQFLPMLVIPIILLTRQSTFDDTRGYWFLLFAYLVAKLFEHFDVAVYSLLIELSGHSIKHVVAAVGVYLLLRSWRRRRIR